jgi:monovalent cation:H+ antiporter-2, CPA2 family
VHQGSPLLSILYVFAAALASATVLARLRQPNIIGYLIGGMVIGPSGLKLVPYENVELLAEIGIGLLMFTIGVELSVSQLLRVRNIAIFGGSGILGATTLICLALSGIFKWSASEAVVWGLVIGLSSTVVVLKLLADRGEVGSLQGNVSTGILLFQDLISIPVLVMLPLLALNGGEAGNHGGEVLLVLGRLGALLAALFFLGRFLVPQMLRFVALTHNKELFSLSVLSITLAIAAITGKAGLSLALGAFLAGLIVSESDFGHQAATEVLPLKDSFSAIFFVSVGMLLNFSYFLEKWNIFTLGLAAVVIVKFFIVLAICFVFRYQNKISVYVALSLAQVSEFGFLILVAAKKFQIMPDESYQRLLGISILSIIATPYLLKLYPRAKKTFAFMNKSRWVVRDSDKVDPGAHLDAGNASLLEKHVILCGYGPTGAIVAKRLQKIGLPVVIVDLNYKQVQALKAQKQHAVYGDSASTIVLEAAGLQNAALLVVTIPDPQAMRALVRKVKRERPDLPIVLRVRYMSDRDSLVALGANEVVWEEQEAGEEVAKRALRMLEINPHSA